MQGIALSEVIGALSYALGLTEGKPPGHAVRTGVIGMRLGEQIGLDPCARADSFYALLLKDAGCSANSARLAALLGADDRPAKHSSKRVDWARALPALVWSVRAVAPGALEEPDLSAWEPADRRLTADETYLDRIADAFAGVVDAKAPWTYRHSDRTCVIAMSIAALLGSDGRCSATCAGRRCCTTSASWRSRTGSSTSPRG